MLSRNRRRLGVLVASVATLSLIPLSAQAVVSPTEDGPSLATAIVTAGVPITGQALAVDYPCTLATPTVAASCPTGVSDTALAGFPTNGNSYGILTTGDAGLAATPNIAGNAGKDWLVTAPAIGATVHDNQTVRIDLGPATTGCLAFDFKFLSEEYPEYLNSGFNDGFVAQLNTYAVTVDATQNIIAPGDFAAGAGDKISVDSSGPSAMTADQAAGTTYDGATATLVARTPVTVGSTNTLYLTTFDQGDGILDTAVFLDNLRYDPVPANQCKSLAVDPFEGETGVNLTGAKATLAKDKKTISIPVTCDLPPGPVPCTVAANLAVSASGKGKRPVSREEALAKAKTKTVAEGTVTLAPGVAGVLTLPTTTKGVKALQDAVKEPKTLLKKANKLLKKAKKAAPAKAKKLRKQAAKLKKKAKKLAKKPVSLTLTLTNPSNGVTETEKVDYKR